MGWEEKGDPHFLPSFLHLLGKDGMQTAGKLPKG